MDSLVMTENQFILGTKWTFVPNLKKSQNFPDISGWCKNGTDAGSQ